MPRSIFASVWDRFATPQKKVKGEIICVDDGSTDGSGEIIDEYVRRSTPAPSACTFRVVHQKNAGAWAARNAALKIAQGEWITFEDASRA